MCNKRLNSICLDEGLYRRHVFAHDLRRCFSDWVMFLEVIRSSNALLAGPPIIKLLTQEHLKVVEDVDICVTEKYGAAWAQYLAEREGYEVIYESSRWRNKRSQVFRYSKVVKRGADSERRVVQLFVFVSQRIEEQYCQLMGISSLMTYWRNNQIVSFFSQQLFSKTFWSTRVGFVGVFPYSGLRYGNIQALREAGVPCQWLDIF
ncbi:hypothetical protein N7460_006871 [Penicillium canescens]|uniref:Uncharacterized protein n=1 Tax=Penicillium canescens TaxID=5083 RepID=A0AAD6ICB2_PENCN|nr:hypothetical protein N7460_006871 [Penicillium canescens]